MTEKVLSFSAWTRQERWLLVTIVVVGVLLRLISYQGVGYLDSLNYAQASLAISEGRIVETLGFHQGNRLAMTAPPAAMMHLFGCSEPALLSWFFLLSVAELIAVPFLLARILRPGPALVAAALHGLSQVAVRSATSNWADAAMSAWADVGMLLLLIPAPTAGRAFVSGAIFGVATLHKETAVVLLPIAGLRLLFAEGGIRAATSRVLAFGGAFALVIGVEMAAFQTLTGDFFYRYRHVDETHGRTVLAGTRRMFDEYTRIWPSNLLRSPQTFGVTLFILPAALLRSLWSPALRRADAWLLAWFLFAALYTLFGTSSTSAWSPLLPYPRYLQFAFLPAAVLCGQYLCGSGERSARGLVCGAVLVTVVAAFVVRLRGADSLIPAVGGAALLLITEFGPRAFGAGIRTTATAVVLVLSTQSLAISVATLRSEAPRAAHAEIAAMNRAFSDGRRAVRAHFPQREMFRYLVSVAEVRPVDVRQFQGGDNPDSTPDEAFICAPSDRARFLAATANGRPLIEAPSRSLADSTEPSDEYSLVVLYPKKP